MQSLFSAHSYVFVSFSHTKLPNQQRNFKHILLLHMPPELAAHFVAASLVTAAVFWAMLGWLSGTLYRRLS